MTREQFTADMNRIAANFAEMAVKHRSDWWRMSMYLGLFSILMIGLAVYFRHWPGIISTLPAAYLSVQFYKNGNESWEKCMNLRADTLRDRDETLAKAHDE